MRPKKTILCVDDNEQALSVRKFMLETRGYRVLTAASSQQALELFREGGIDLVLSDLIMPYMEQEAQFRNWDLNKTYYDQTDVARQSPVKSYFCPSRRTAQTAGLSVEGDYSSTGPANAPNVPGALCDYAVSLGMKGLDT